MKIIIRKADINDMEFLIDLRLEVLKAANGLDNDCDLTTVQQHTRMYYESNLNCDNHIEYLAFVENTFVGCGAASIYQVMPTYNNALGKKAYVMNMYTRKEYRHKGIADKILKQLIADIHSMKITQIQLEATNDGKPLYEKFGFRVMTAEMELV